MGTFSKRLGLDNVGPMQSPASLYLPVALFFGVILCALIPPNCVPDESSHYLRTEAVSRGQFWPRVVPPWGGGALPDGVIALSHALRDVQQRTRNATRADFSFVTSIKDGDHLSEISYQTGGSIYPFVAYLPAALTLFITRLLGAPPLVRFYSGRVTNLLVATLLTFLAIRILPIWPLFLVGTLPITLQQYASLSADSMLLSLFLLSLALIARQDSRSIAAITTLSWVKFPYISAAIGLLPSPRLRYWLWIPALGAVSAWALTRQYIPLHHTEPGYAVSPAEQLIFVLKNPLAFSWVCVKTLWQDTGFYFKTMFTLGYLNVYAGDIAKYGWSAALLFTFAASTTSVSRSVRKWLAISVVFGLLLVLFSQYLMWTPVGDRVVLGPQGRYFIPFLLCLLIPGERPRLNVENKTLARVSLLGATLAFVCSAIASLRYYGV